MASELNVGDGNMDYISDEHDRQILENAYKAITFTNSWEFIREKNLYNGSDELCHEKLKEISNMMVQLGYDSHSGFSFRWAMNAMKYLVTNGEDSFKDLYG